MALHGKAFNPDTSKLAEYKELSHRSDGDLWQAANTTEIHRLAQGNDIIPGTNTIFSSLSLLSQRANAPHIYA